MGKKARKLRSPKYALKAAALRKRVATVRGHIENITESIQEKVEQVVENVKPMLKVTKKKESPPKPFAEEEFKTYAAEYNEPREESINNENSEQFSEVETNIAKPKPKTRARKATTTKKKTASTPRRKRTAKTKVDS